MIFLLLEEGVNGFKQTKSSKKLMPDAPLEFPYEGAREMFLVEDIDNKEFLNRLFNDMYDELPVPKKYLTI